MTHLTYSIHCYSILEEADCIRSDGSVVRSLNDSKKSTSSKYVETGLIPQIDWLTECAGNSKTNSFFFSPTEEFYCWLGIDGAGITGLHR